MEIPKAYEPSAVESKWYQFWLDQKFFVANPDSPRPAYSIVIPPPNVTGVLHMGHVLNNTIQDILARKARMDGKEVLWLPGTDHAGIATEGMVEKQIRKEEHKTKRDLGREEFLKRVWQWKEKHGGIIIEQLKKLGSSCDWSRERFTMDEDYVRCVQRVFVELYKKGLIYRGKRMVNWCPATLTALSDEEVDMEPQKGALYYFRVEVAESPLTLSLSPPRGEGARRVGEGEKPLFGPITDEQGRVWLTIATTRPETIPGDTAVAVNPKDQRYAALIGKHVLRPLPAEYSREKKLIPIIADEHIDPEFGTGVLKVTPAHDKADFEIWERIVAQGVKEYDAELASMEPIEIMNPNATMNDLAGIDLRGLDRFEARKVAVEKLKSLGSLVKEEPYENKVGFSQRAKVPIEPRLSEQWFLKYPSVEPSKNCVEQPDEKGSAGASPASAGALAGGSEGTNRAADEASAAAREGACAPRKMRFHPQRWAKVYDHWMTNIQDWCISRQLWWGHRIPVWYLKGQTSPSNQNYNEEVKRRLATGDSRLNPVSGGILAYVDIEPPDDRENWQQDPDVLDTWCSSWLWPFATMGWPEQTPTLKKFYPTTDLVTAPDIIFFWVARMIMAGYEFMGEMPFRNVYFTGIIRDKQGRKMSKTLGNSPDALELIAKYGADALRFGTMRSAPLGQDVLFDEKDVELGRNFCNKLWNACRFRQMQGGEVQGEIDPSKLSSDDKWILLKLHIAIRELTDALANYKFNEAAQTLYRFFWSEFCDWYLEASKAFLQGPSEAKKANTLAVLDFVLSHALRLFHPFLPFITEELWHGMGYNEEMPADQGGRSIMFAPWPKPFDADMRDFYSLDDCYIDFVDAKYEVVTLGRNLRREANIPSSKKVKFIFKPAESVSPNDAAVLKVLLNAEAFEINADFQPPKGTPVAHSSLGELFLPMEGLVDVAAEKTRLTKELEKVAAEIAKVEQKLNNPAFVQKVPPQVLQEHQKRLADWQAKQQQLQRALEALA